ncbi:helix-turn-helix domain-containing protein [Paenibacillus sp. 8b26]|uniref:helix-turn-helix domain-containing protein n=1 Tax=Paenibacillus sp. 8b26 TaxID=3424133 RepID=UPI003D64839C
MLRSRSKYEYKVGVNVQVFGKRLKAERERCKLIDPKWTQEYVANLLGVARSTYTAYENGTKQPSMNTLAKIADTFNVKVDYLYGRSNDPSSDSSLSPPSAKENLFVKDMELTDQELLNKYNITVDGKTLTHDEAKDFIAFVRSKRSLK